MDAPEDARPSLTLVRGLPPERDRLARLDLDERIRGLRLRGEKAYAIARAVGVEVGYVTKTLKRFEREYERQAELDAKAAAAVYRREMIDRLEKLKREAWQQLDLAKDQKKRTAQEMLKDTDGKITHQRVKVDTLPGETSPGLIGEIRQLEAMLGKLHGVEIEEPPQPTAPTVGRDLILINPSAPLDVDRVEQLNAVIRKRMNGGAVIDVPLIVGGNGNGNGNGGLAS
jgi:hypothetical protein